MTSNRVRRTTTQTMTFVGNLTAGDLVAFAECLPPETSVRVSVSAGDRPWESETTTITATAPAADQSEES